MAELRLKFSGAELIETSFDHPLLHSPRRAIRGKTSGAYAGAHSFQWTPALQTLCSLLLRTAAWRQGKNQPTVTGASDSGAAALDYAISRGVDWIDEIFGSDSKGNSIAKRLFRRTNPERKRPGPVVISINLNFLDPGQIKVYLEEREATRSVSLLSLASLLEDRLVQKKTNRLPRKTTEASFPLLQYPPLGQRLAEGFRKEIRQMLRSTDIFNRSRSFSLLQQLRENPSFIRIAGHPDSVVSDLDLNLAGAHRLGSAASEAEIRKQLCQGRPITFGVTPSQSGTIAILYFLKYWKGYNIRIDYHFAHTYEMVLGMTTGGGPDFPDCCAISVASAGPLFQRKGEYHSLMMIPAATHRIVAKKRSHLNQGRYLFLNEIPTTPSFYFEELERDGFINRRQVAVEHRDPDETTRLLAEGDPDIKAILWFPHHLFNEMFNGVSSVAAPIGQCDSLCNLLFVHDSLIKDRPRTLSLDVAIRDAWLNLICDDSLLEAVLQKMLSNGAYLKFLARCSGLHNLDLESKRRGSHSVWQNLHLC